MAVNLEAAFRANGHEVSVFAERVEGEKTSHVRRVPVSRLFSALRVYSFHRNLRELLKAGDYDVVFGLTQFFPLDIYRAGGGVHAHWMRLRYQNSVWRTIKYIISPVHLVMTWLEKKIMEQGNHRFVIANSELVRKHLVQYFAVPREDIKVVYNGVDHKLFNLELKNSVIEVREELGIGPDKTVALFVSNNWERKGLRTILRALARVKTRDMTLVVVGRGKVEKYAALMNELDLDDETVVFAGVRSDVERLYGAADFFVLPTQYDPCANTCVEAMASGLPVVTTKSNGASEHITEGVDGYVLDDWTDDKGLGEFLNILSSRNLCLSMGEKAVKSVSDLTWERTAGEMIELLTQLSKVRQRD